MAEGLMVRNPAMLLFTPKAAAKPVRKVMNMKEVQMLFGALDQRERLVAKLAVMAECVRRDFCVDLGNPASVLRRYSAEGLPGNHRLAKNLSIRSQAALPEGLLRDIEVWRMMAVSTRMMRGSFRPNG